MKVCTVDMQTDSGKLKSASFASAAPAMALAKQVRASGMYDGERIVRGIVRASWESGTRMSFVAAEPEGEAKKQRAKK